MRNRKKIPEKIDRPPNPHSLNQVTLGYPCPFCGSEVATEDRGDYIRLDCTWCEAGNMHFKWWRRSQWAVYRFWHRLWFNLFGLVKFHDDKAGWGSDYSPWLHYKLKWLAVPVCWVRGHLGGGTFGYYRCNRCWGNWG